MLSINTNLSSLNVQKNLTKSTINLNQAIERLTTGYKINHASDNAANYSISRNYDTKLSAYDVAQDNVAMASSMMATASDTLDNMTTNAMRLRELCVQAQNGTYGKQSISAIKSEASSIISHILTQYKSAEYNGINLFDIYSDKLAQIQANSATPETPIGLSSDISPKYNGFIADPVTYTDEEVEAMTSLSSVSADTTISSGTYKISSKDELKQLATMTNSGKITSNSVTFVLGADIDLEGEEWTAIGTFSNSFIGTFDGNGHVITGLKFDNGTTICQGLFGRTASGSTIKNIGIVNVEVTGKDRVGGLVGWAYGYVTNCYSTGTVNGTSYVGGLAGTASSSTIKNCYSTVNINGNWHVGGLVGDSSSVIHNCYATGNVSGKYNIGGFVGIARNSITNCYATGDVSSISSSYGSFTGGLVGKILKTSGSAEFKNNASFGKVTAKYEAGSGSLIGGIANTSDGTNFANITITNCMTNSNDGKDAIGATYKLTGDSTYSLIDEPEIMSEWNSNITSFDTKTTLQVGIYGNNSSQITTQINIDFGLMKQLESLDVSKVSSIEFIDSFLEKLNNKSTELGAVTDRLMSAADSISTAIDNLTSSRSTIKDADIAKESSNYIKSQILQQASAALLSTANLTPQLTLQLLQGLH